jgi:uncharacterized protein (TIGR00369 family)
MADSAPPPGFRPHDGSGEFMELIGPVFAAEDGGSFAVRVGERHRNAAGTVHGGLLMALADFAIGQAIRSDAHDGASPATVSLTTDFLRPVRPGAWVQARAEVERLGGTLAFADCSLRAGEDEVVRARAVFAVGG